MTTDSHAACPPLFSPITIEQKERAEEIRKASGSTLYVYTFASLFAWREAEQYEICFGDGAFLVKNGASGDRAYLYPCGTPEGKRALIDALVQCEKPVFYDVTDHDRRFLEEAYPGRFRFEDCRDEYPYLYDKNEQIALAGKAYKSLRHQIHLGRAVAGTWSAEPLTDENAERALALNVRWAQARGAEGLADTAAAETALRHFSSLSMWGLLFQADGSDLAYVAGSFITPEIFDIAFCKVLDQRCDCYIKWALYGTLPAEVKTVDSEDDMGLEGLRRHKLLRRPKELTRVWKGSLIV